MGRRAHAWTLHRDPRTKIWCVRVTIDGRRFNRSTGETDRAGAQRAGAAIADALRAGQGPVRPVAVGPIDELLGGWMVDYGADHASETAAQIRRYGARFAATFQRVERLTSASIASYQRARLREVTASTVRKESSALRSFLAWCVEQGHMIEPPAVPSIPKKATGTRSELVGEQVRVTLSADDAERLIAEMPETTRGGHAGRSIVTLMWETGLRVATLKRLEVPRHFHPGASSLTITPDVDKARYGRVLPLTPRALAVLELEAPDEGLIFGAIDIRESLKSAAVRAGIARGERLSVHDIRHAAITHMASGTTNVAGIAFLAGHRWLTTTSRYVHAQHESAAAVLASRVYGTPKRTPEGNPPPSGSPSTEPTDPKSPSDQDR